MSPPGLETVVETTRCLLRRLVGSDIDWVCEMLSDEDVMRFYPARLDRRESVQWIANQKARYRKDGYGLWAAVRKDDHTAVGQVGVSRQIVGEQERTEVGYLLRREFWSMGYATELARACKRYAFDKLGKTEVVSMIRPENARSVAVALRNGMTLERVVFWRGFEHGIYRVNRTRDAKSDDIGGGGC